MVTFVQFNLVNNEYLTMLLYQSIPSTEQKFRYRISSAKKADHPRKDETGFSYIIYPNGRERSKKSESVRAWLRDNRFYCVCACKRERKKEPTCRPILISFPRRPHSRQQPIMDHQFQQQQQQQCCWQQQQQQHYQSDCYFDNQERSYSYSDLNFVGQVEDEDDFEEEEEEEEMEEEEDGVDPVEKYDREEDRLPCCFQVWFLRFFRIN